MEIFSRKPVFLGLIFGLCFVPIISLVLWLTADNFDLPLPSKYSMEKSWLKQEKMELVCVTREWYRGSPSTEQCTLKNSRKENVWNLVFKDDFYRNNGYNIENNWIVEHESNGCKSLGLLRSSCFDQENVKIAGNQLNLMAKGNRGRFTSAAITSKQSFGPGRYEIKARLPLDEFVRVDIHTLRAGGQGNHYKETGHLHMLTYQDRIIYRSAHPYYQNVANLPKNYYLYYPKVLDFTKTGSLKGFHVFGVEFNQTASRFFFDNQYTETQILSNFGKFWDQHQIRFQLTVGGERFFEDFPKAQKRGLQTNSRLEIDYVQVFEPVNPNSPI